jgi:hypothetical protein
LMVMVWVFGRVVVVSPDFVSSSVSHMKTTTSASLHRMPYAVAVRPSVTADDRL